MPADPQTVERLVEIVTRQVLIALAEEERQAVGLGVECAEECGAGHCIRHCGSKVELIVHAGADRIAAGLGAAPAQPELAGMIDHTLLKPDATHDQIAQLCYEARKYGFAAVCVNPTHVALAAQLLRGSNVAVCTVVGFPLGATPPEVKAYEAQLALDQGATEIDMVINIGALKSKDYEMVARDIRAVVRVCHAHTPPALVKVIIEAALLSDEEKIAASLLSKESDADYVKTSTGFASGGATVADVALMRRAVGPEMGVKAAGGIRTREDADAMVQAGATRIGASAGIKIVQTAPAGATPAPAAAPAAPRGRNLLMPTPEEAAAPPPGPVSYVCPQCQTGTLHLRRVVFAKWYGGQFVTMPNFPGWVCDVCGQREYDAVALEQINTLLGAELDLRQDASRRSRRSLTNLPSRTRPTGRRRV